MFKEKKVWVVADEYWDERSNTTLTSLQVFSKEKTAKTYLADRYLCHKDQKYTVNFFSTILK